MHKKVLFYGSVDVSYYRHLLIYFFLIDSDTIMFQVNSCYIGSNEFESVVSPLLKKIGKG